MYRRKNWVDRGVLTSNLLLATSLRKRKIRAVMRRERPADRM
jgi:hypothetical protein